MTAIEGNLAASGDANAAAGFVTAFSCPMSDLISKGKFLPLSRSLIADIISATVWAVGRNAGSFDSICVISNSKVAGISEFKWEGAGGAPETIACSVARMVGA